SAPYSRMHNLTVPMPRRWIFAPSVRRQAEPISFSPVAELRWAIQNPNCKSPPHSGANPVETHRVKKAARVYDPRRKLRAPADKQEIQRPGTREAAAKYPANARKAGTPGNAWEWNHCGSRMVLPEVEESAG